MYINKRKTHELTQNLYIEMEKKMLLDKKIESSSEFNSHISKYDYFNSSSIDDGKFFLYEAFYLRNKSKQSFITYPALGIHLNTIPIDQTIEVEWFKVRRSSEYNQKTYYKPSKLDSLILWEDMIMVYGIWDHKPNWKEMKLAYDKTWWFRKTKSEKRKIKINNILKEI